MTLNSMLFLWLFLPVCLFLYWQPFIKGRRYILLFLSLGYWLWNSPIHFLLYMVVAHIVYLCVRNMYHKDNKKIYLIISVCLSIGLLVVYKLIPTYIDADKITGLLKTPAGLSFICFSLVSYIVDSYRSDSKTSYIDFLNYISFFPKLLMGPIERYKDFVGEVGSEKELDYDQFAQGIRMFSFGLGKKVLIADLLAILVNDIFSRLDLVGTSVVWLGSIAYMLQIYYDFSGYSDMAIGTAKMLGINLHKNFNYPYMSQSITEFWRRWHISLGTWFREYLYIPLGGNRKGKIRTYINLCIVFIATGIWHGSGMHFLLWGIWNGFFMIVERIFLLSKIENNKFKLINHLYALLVTFFGWILFRVESLEEYSIVISKLLKPTTGLIGISEFINPRVGLLLIIGILFSGFIQEKLTSVEDKKWSNGLALCVFTISVIGLVSGAAVAFIYAQF